MKNSVEFPIMVTYSQIVVFDRSLEEPFNDWTDAHVAQGFSWRPGSVGFATVEEGGYHLVTVEKDFGEGAPALSAVRVIDVPFEVPSDGFVEIASISDSNVIGLAPGTYQLRFECYAAGDTRPSVRLLFSRRTSPVFRLVRADSGLEPSRDLLRTASPA